MSRSKQNPRLNRTRVRAVVEAGAGSEPQAGSCESLLSLRWLQKCRFL